MVSAIVVLTGCGSETTQTEDKNSAALNSTNYIEVAKSIYTNPEKVTKGLPPHATVDANTLYLTKVVKPRDYKISTITAVQGDASATVKVDNNYKYATITLTNSTNQSQEKVNLKDFTLNR